MLMESEPMAEMMDRMNGSIRYDFGTRGERERNFHLLVKVNFIADHFRQSFWNDMDEVLEETGKIDLELTILNPGPAEKLYALLGEHCAEIAPLKDRRDALEQTASAFCILNKSEFTKKRSRQLTLGKIAFRVSERIEFPADMEEVVIATHLSRIIAEFAGKPRKEALEALINPAIATAASGLAEGTVPIKLDLAKLIKVLPKTPGSQAQPEKKAAE